MKIISIVFSLIIISYTNIYSQEKNSVVRFRDLVVTIKSFEALDKRELNTVFDNEAVFIADVGATLDSSKIVIHSDKYVDLFVYQAFETSVTIMNEGPHCDLIDWKHYNSNWIPLVNVSSNIFRATTFTVKESTFFPKVTIQEVIGAVTEKCGSKWADLMQNSKSVYDYPCEIAISRFFFRITAIDKLTGGKIDKKITILIPMGC